MKHLVKINDATPEGAGLMEVLKKLPKTTVEILDEEDELTGTVSAEEFFGELRKEVKKKFQNKEKLG